MSEMNPEESPSEAPAGNLPKAYDPSIIEQRWAEYWVRQRLFDVPTPASSGSTPEAFTMLLPPPNVTGRLHMGHMLNQTEMDILTRWHRMRGETSLWVPGTDHAGIATQMMVERQLAAEGTHRKALGREAFEERVWAWKNQYGSAITSQMKRLGASVDWSREYFTMDDRLSIAVKEAFVRLYEQGLIYRGSYIVNWDPVQQTAVSDLEVESEERIGKLYSIRYPFVGAMGPFDDTNSIVIATTRPETMLGDVAVAVNPADPRYRHLVGTMLQLPLTKREIPILADDWAKPEFGTGAVKVTPAHDPNDFAIGQRHNLPSLTILDETAHIVLPGSPFHGLDRFEARTKMVARLEEAGLLVEVKDHPMTIPISQRSGAVIEPRLSMQWFLAVGKPVAPGRPSIAQTAIDAVQHGHIRFTPEMYSKTYMEWMNNIHDWCISRQLWWGHRIPAWHCNACGKITVARHNPGACSGCGITDIHQETDVLDTWFSSGLLPLTVFGWPLEQETAAQEAAKQETESSAHGADPGDAIVPDAGRHSDRTPESPYLSSTSNLTPDLAAFYPTSVLVTGFDILFFWVARMIMLGTHFMLDVPMPDGSPRPLAEAVPFKTVYIHALVRDANREKMSKTKGNVIDPIEIITRYGTDAVRFTLASQASPGTDIAFNEARTEGYRAFANKIWNAARFLFMNLDRAREAGYKVSISTNLGAGTTELPDHTPLETRWILYQLNSASLLVNTALQDYRFDEAANYAYRFIWHNFCDWYIELIKMRLDFSEGGNPLAATVSLNSLVVVFEASLRLLSPFMPFITEELWHALYAGNPPRPSIALADYPQGDQNLLDDNQANEEMVPIIELIATVRALRKELNVPEKDPAPIALHAGARILALTGAHADMLGRLARVSAIEFSTAPLSGNNARSTPSFDVAVLYERPIDVAAERERLAKDLARYEKVLAANDARLADAKFTAKAPAHIVEGLRQQTAETRGLYERARSALDNLPPS